MLSDSRSRLSILLGAVILLAGTFVVASAATNHHLVNPSDRHGGELTRTVSITPSGGSGISSMDLAFHNLLPGSAQTVTVTYRNTGTSPEDVYVLFTNATALSALNSLGRYGSFHLVSTGAGSVGDIFDSFNLNDNAASCGTFTTTGCWPLRAQYPLAHNIGPTTTGSLSFTFEFASAYSTQAPAGTSRLWNAFPISGQTHVSPSDGSGAGLAYAIVATQPGITPGQKGTISQIDPFGSSVHVADSGASFKDALRVVGASGAVTYVVTSPNAHLVATSGGTLSTTGGPLSIGDYRVSGTDSDAYGDTGTWTYSLHVTSTHLACGGPRDRRIASSHWRGFADQLSVSSSTGPSNVTFAGGDGRLHVASDGRISTNGAPPAPGTYAISGSCRDSNGDDGTWSYSVTVTP